MRFFLSRPAMYQLVEPFSPTDKPLPEGKEVQLEIILGIKKLNELLGFQCQIKVKGKVVRSEERGMAIRFHRNYKMKSTKPPLYVDTHETSALPP